MWTVRLKLCTRVSKRGRIPAKKNTIRLFYIRIKYNTLTEKKRKKEKNSFAIQRSWLNSPFYTPIRVVSSSVYGRCIVYETRYTPIISTCIRHKYIYWLYWYTDNSIMVNMFNSLLRAVSPFMFCVYKIQSFNKDKYTRIYSFHLRQMNLNLSYLNNMCEIPNKLFAQVYLFLGSIHILFFRPPKRSVFEWEIKKKKIWQFAGCCYQNRIIRVKKKKKSIMWSHGLFWKLFFQI